MSKVLYIKANAKPKGVSRTFRISDAFVESYKESHPDDEIVTLDLYKEDIKPLTGDDLDTVFGPKTEDSKNHPVLKYAYQFAEADKYIIAAPLWNLGLPGIVKLYFDYVSVVGITFKYVSGGGVSGLLEGKKAIHIVTRGGEYSTPPLSEFEMGDKYVRTIFGLFGVYDVDTFAIENMDRSDTDVEAVVTDAIKDAEEKAENF
ncbi:MAG: FMN-dependent NADH-azoreductase [Firmicutes bacterium]|nr:FMN-dependent NADH-azoreductase [Bacillota bacterium]